MSYARRSIPPAIALLLALAHGAGAQSGSEYQVSTTTGFDSQPAAASGGTGNFVVVWTNYGAEGSSSGVFGRRFASTGVPLGADFLVNTYTTGMQWAPAVAVGAGGSFVVAWESYGPDGSDGSLSSIAARRYDSTGAPLGAEFQVNTYTTGPQRAPAVAVDAAGNFVVVWESFYNQDGDGAAVIGRRFDSAGAPLSGEFMVNTYTTGAQYAPAVAAGSGGNFLVVWTSDDQDALGAGGIFGQRYDSAGTPLGSEFPVNTFTLDGQRSPAVAADGVGNFIVVWESGPSQDGDGVGVFGQRYDGAGTPLGGEFQVNTYTTRHQSYPAVAADAAGTFVVSWEATVGYPLSDVFARRFDSTGAPVDGDFQVNTYTNHHQFRPAVSTDGSGNFFAAWIGEAPFNVFNILGKRLGAFLPLVGTRLLISDTAGPSSRLLRVTFGLVASQADAGTALNPVANGAFLHVFNAAGGADSACLDLPASGWTQRGDPSTPTFVYRDPTFANGPCKIVRARKGKPAKAVCSGLVAPLPYTLDEASQTGVDVRFGSGSVEFCAEFGGQVVRDQPGVFVARRTGNAAACTVPPPGCP